jgi:hypothetical protein
MGNIGSKLLLRIILINLTFFSSLWAVTWPTGTQSYIPITANHAYVGEDNNNYLYQYKLVLNDNYTFKTRFDSAANITVFDTVTGLQYPSRITYTNKDTVYIYFNALASTSADKQFFICAGKTINRTNSSTTFTNSNITNYWNLGDSVSPVIDAADSKNGTVTGATLGTVGQFGKCATFSSSKNNYINFGTNITAINNTQHLTYDFLVNVTSFTGYTEFFVHDSTTALTDYVELTSTTFNWYLCNGTVGTRGYFLLSGNMTAGAWHHVVCTFDGTQATNANKMKIYVDNVPITLTFADSIPSSTPNIPITDLTFGYGAASLYGQADELSIRSTTESAGDITSRYNMLMNPTLFWTKGTEATLIKDKWPIGTNVVISLTVNHLKVGEVAANYCYQKVLLLANDTRFKSAFNSAANICIFDSSTGLVRPSRITYNTKDSVYVYFDGATSTSADKVFFACAGPTINRTNGSAAFTNSNITNYWGLGDSVSPVIDAAGNKNGTVTGATLGTTGQFGRCASYANGTDRITFATIPALNNTNKFTYNFLVKYNSITATGYHLIRYQSATDKVVVEIGVATFKGSVYNGTELGVGTFPTSDLSNGNWYYIVVVYDGSQSTNASRLKIYVNNTEKTLNFGTTTVPAAIANTTPIVTFGTATTGNNLDGYLDESLISSDAYTSGRVTSRYEMVMNPATFWTQGASFGVGKNQSRWIAFKDAFKLPFFAAFKMGQR